MIKLYCYQLNYIFMFFIKNIEKSFNFFLKNTFVWNEGFNFQPDINEDAFKGWDLSDLNTLKNLVSDWKIDSSDADFILSNIDEIKWEAELWLKEIVNKIFLQEGFSAKNERTYNSFKALSESKIKLSNEWEELSLKIPDFNEVIQKVLDNNYHWINWVSKHKNDPLVSHLSREDFHWITVMWDKIEVKYDSWGDDDTFEIRFNPLNGKIISHEWKVWENQYTDVSWESKIDISSMDDNIASLEEKIQREEDLRKQGEKDKEQDEEIGSLDDEIEEVDSRVDNLWEQTQEALEDVKVILEEQDDTINEFHSDELEAEKISPENKRKFEKAEKWYESHGWLENSYQIREIKKILEWAEYEDYNISEIDWKFDANFFNAVIKYQENNWLKTDWLVWRKTFENMMKFYKDGNILDTNRESREYYNIEKYEKAEKWYKAKVWTNPESIVKLQGALIDEWHDDIWFVDWKFNYELMQKIIEFQETNWETPDGLAWYKTLKALWVIDNKTEYRKFYKK